VVVDEELERFDRWLASLDVVPTIAALSKRGEEVVEAVLAENESRWESLSDADRERMRTMASAVVRRLLHEPTVRLKGSVGEESSYLHVQALRDLFALDVDPPSLKEERPSEVADLDARRRRRG